MLQLFSDRERELQFLEKHYKTQTAELVVLYGRRRVGKTELCLQFSKSKVGINVLFGRKNRTLDVPFFSVKFAVC